MWIKSILDINIEEAITYDVSLHGRGFIIGEFVVGIIAGLFITVLSFIPPQKTPGSLLLSLAGIGYTFNCLSVVVLAVLAARHMDQARQKPLNLDRLKRYAWQLPLAVLLPFVLTGLALFQRIKTRSAT